jgi:CRP-like cAMP-binding protein
MLSRFQAALPIALPNALLAILEQHLTERRVAKDELLLHPGPVCRDIYFVSQGLLRQYLLKDGQERNVEFGLPGDFLTEYQSLTTQQPARHYLQALEQSQLLVLRREVLLQLYEQEPAFQTLGRALLEKLAAAQQQRIETLACLTAAERYAQLLARQPALVQRVPLHQLASYLGVARETLSRVRRQLTIQ